MQKKQYVAPQIAEIGRLNEVVNTQRDTFDYDGAPIIKGNMVLILLTFSTGEGNPSIPLPTPRP
jgi:hypothetical protein